MIKRSMLFALLAALAFVPGGASAAPSTVGIDDAGDYGQGTDPDLDFAIAIAGAEAGMDLVSASISPEGDTVNFIIGVTKLPENGGTPEAARYTWDIDVDGALLELDGKFTNYSRGACDPTAGTCPPPRDPGEAPFAVRGNCETTQNITLCEELALVHATFDVATATITIPVPTSLIDGCVLAGGTGLFGGSISAAPAAFFTNNSMPMDTMIVHESVDLCA